MIFGINNNKATFFAILAIGLDTAANAIDLYGDEVNNNPAGPLHQCEGDCDNDKICCGEMVCYQFDQVTGQTLPPGCTGSIYNHPVAGVYDYCGCPQSNPNCDTFGSCSGNNVKPSASGDPHFKTWTGEKYDYQGGCDLILFSNTNFANGLGLDVHVRTKIDTWWSYIETAVVSIGGNTLEITGGTEKIGYYLNGVQVEDMETGDATLGDYAIRFQRINKFQSRTRVDLGNTNALSIETRKKFVRVNVKATHPADFNGSYGMLGAFPGGQKVGRDKTTIIEDINEFGQEWMVSATDPKLFQEESAIQAPMKCPLPDMTSSDHRRRLGESSVGIEEATLACSKVNEDDRDACIADVLVTHDTGMADVYN